ncbi:outer membrane beta-barrel protein, partial [Neisseria gonorrhoeae]
SSLLFSSLLFSSAAQAASEDSGHGPYYVQADLAYAAERITHDYPKATGANNTSTVSDYFRNIRTHSIHPRVSVGYDFGSWRIAADYARYRKWNNNKYSVNTKLVKIGGDERLRNEQTLKTEHQENGTFHAVSSLGLSTIYDFDTGSRFKPYIGMRVAYGHVRHQVRSVESETTIVLSTPKGVQTPGRHIQGPTKKPAHHESRSISSLGFGAVAGVGIDITPNLTLDAGYRYHNWGRLENTRFKTHEASLGMRYRF